jgi:phosphomannomutase
VYYYRRLVHTPLVPFGVAHLNAACGVMITASHNPKEDNGYKVYWDNACQIIPPHDREISKAIEDNLEPWIWDKTLVDHTIANLCMDPIDQILPAYYKIIGKLVDNPTLNANCPIAFAYTAMHGVGHPYARQVFECFSLPAYKSISIQCEPDPDFPTVTFPNPEERGALDVAQAMAKSINATVVLANDPDADRFTAVERQAKDGMWRMFTGNELGVLFADALWRDCVDRQNIEPSKIAMICTVVSSQMLARMGSAEGFHVEECLTGFKWIGNRAITLKADGYTVPFAYEEAIGYMIGDVVPDKDGISALGYFAQLTAKLYAKGTTLAAHLDGLYEKYGYFRSNNSYVKCYDPVTIRQLFDRIRYGEESQPSPVDPPILQRYPHALQYPTTIGGHRVTRTRDLTIGYDSKQPDGQSTLPVSASTQMITFELEHGSRITLRTSGTEPKIKWYIEHYGENINRVDKELATIVEAVVEGLLEPERNQLIR